MAWRDGEKPHQNLHLHFTPDVIYHTKAAFYGVKVFHTIKYLGKPVYI